MFLFYYTDSNNLLLVHCIVINIYFKEHTKFYGGIKSVTEVLSTTGGKFKMFKI